MKVNVNEMTLEQVKEISKELDEDEELNVGPHATTQPPRK